MKAIDQTLILLIILTIILIIIFCFLNTLNSNKSTENFETKTPKIIWTYWENLNGATEYPTHIKLCLETFYKHLSNYQIIVLDQNLIKQYLPNVRNDFDQLLIAQKVDYYRIALLEKYGGIWIDADTIIMRNFDEIFEKLDSGYDFVGFGCTGVICFNGKYRPSNWLLASKKNGLLMKTTLDLLNNKLNLIKSEIAYNNNNNNNNNNYGYHDFGKLVIWQAIDILKKNNNYDYYHYGAEYDGSRDSDGYWIETSRHFDTKNIKLIDESKLFLVFLTNSGINEQQPWVATTTRDKLLNGPYWISKYFRKSLNL